MAFLLVIEHEAVQKRLIKITLEYVGSSDEPYNGMTETGKKKITVSLLSNLGLSTARCEQIVHKGGQASVSAEVARASSNCLKHERRKKKWGTRPILLRQFGLRALVVKFNPAQRLKTTANETVSFAQLLLLVEQS
ncbi:MAG TPA: hypothetical protein VIM04_12390 [Candidatus Binatia bacterium]|jgi:hypothetical protein